MLACRAALALRPSPRVAAAGHDAVQPYLAHAGSFVAGQAKLEQAQRKVSCHSAASSLPSSRLLKVGFQSQSTDGAQLLRGRLENVVRNAIASKNIVCVP